MKIENYLQVSGIIIGVGILSTYISLTHGIWLIKHGGVIPIMLGLADILRWVIGIVAAVYIVRLKIFSQWLLLVSFLFGLFSSWVSFVPFGGYAIHFAAPTSWVQNFVAIQGPNLFLIILIFCMFSKLKKSNKSVQPTAKSASAD